MVTGDEQSVNAARGGRTAMQALVAAGVVAALVAVCGGVLVLALPAIQAAGEHAEVEQGKTQLRQIFAALERYHASHESLPPAVVSDPAGRPLHSWRVLLLPELGYQELYDEYDFSQPWDGPANRALHDRMPAVYGLAVDDPDTRHTNVAVISGPGAVFHGERTFTWQELEAAGGMAKRTVLLAETTAPICWLEPRDLDPATLPPRINPTEGAGIGSRAARGPLVMMVSGNVVQLDPATTPEQLRGMIYLDANP